MRRPPEERSPEELLRFGVVNIDKPPGPSAHQVAAWVRDLAEVKRAAHAGTLDPKVTGCLPVLTGGATRAAMALEEARKEYVTILELHSPAPADLESVIKEFEGPILQKPPRKSAVKRRLRERTIHNLEVLETDDRRALLRVECEAGTYVRKLCHDLGLALGTGANMGDLRRSRTGTFDDTTLVTMHDFIDALTAWRKDGDDSWLRHIVAPAERTLVGLPSVTIARSAATQVGEGAPVYAPGVLDADEAEEGVLVACYTPDGTAICLGRLVGDPKADSGTVVDLERVLI